MIYPSFCSLPWHLSFSHSLTGTCAKQMFIGTKYDLKLAHKWSFLLPPFGSPALFGNWGKPLQRVVCWEPPARTLPVISGIYLEEILLLEELRMSGEGSSSRGIKGEGVSGCVSLHARWNSSMGKVICGSCTFTSWDEISSARELSDEQWAALATQGCYWPWVNAGLTTFPVCIFSKAILTFSRVLWLARGLEKVKPWH